MSGGGNEVPGLGDGFRGEPSQEGWNGDVTGLDLLKNWCSSCHKPFFATSRAAEVTFADLPELLEGLFSL